MSRRIRPVLEMLRAFSGPPRPQKVAAVAGRTAVGEKTDIGSSGGTVDAQVIQSLSAADDRFIGLSLPVGVAVGKDNPAITPVVGA